MGESGETEPRHAIQLLDCPIGRVGARVESAVANTRFGGEKAKGDAPAVTGENLRFHAVNGLQAGPHVFPDVFKVIFTDLY